MEEIGSAGADGSQGTDGGQGESCGIVNIHNDTIIYAYGGTGGSGGSGHPSASIGGGSGGYPGAGIGGGGAGGSGATDCSGAGGYTGGAGRENGNSSENGLAGNGSHLPTLSGGGYFQGGIGNDDNSLSRESICLGGFHAYGLAKDGSHRSGDGGTAGSGGTISVSKDAKVYAYNGNLFTDGTSYENGVNQCPIYAQNGKVPARYEYISLGSGTATVYNFRLNSTPTVVENNIALSGYTNNKYISTSTEKEETYVSSRILNINTILRISTNNLLNSVDMSKQGVGSGAGYIEVSNGSYTRYNEDSIGNFTTIFTSE